MSNEDALTGPESSGGDLEVLDPEVGGASDDGQASPGQKIICGCSRLREYQKQDLLLASS